MLVNGVPDRTANAETFAAYLKQFFTNGVILNTSTSLQVYAGDGMSVQIRQGIGFINGRILITDTTEYLNLETAPATQKRIDRIIMRLDLLNRLIDLVVLTGQPGSTPAAPALTRNDAIYELCLAEVEVGAAYTAISQANITDTRANSEVCGLVVAAMKQIDTTSFYEQLTAQFNQWFYDLQNSVDDDSLPGVIVSLSALQTLVNNHVADYNAHLKNLGTTAGTGAAYAVTAAGYTPKAGDSLIVTFHADSLAGATLAVNGAAVPLFKTDGKAAGAGDLKANVPIMLTYAGNKYFFKSGGIGGFVLSAGDNQLYKDTAVYSVTTQTMEMMRAIKLFAGGTIRVKVQLYADTYAKVELRKNNVMFKEWEVPYDKVNHDYINDIDIAPGDQISLWGRTNGNVGYFLAVRNFEIGTEKGMLYEKYK